MADQQSGERAADAFSAYVNEMLNAGRTRDIPDTLLQNIMTSAIKAYSAKVEETQQEFSPIDTCVITATEGATAACAIIRALHLNMFDISMWFNRPGPKAPGL